MARVGVRWFAFFTLAWVALWAVQLTPLQLLLPLQLDTDESAGGWIPGVVSSGLVLGVGGLAGVVAGPLAGALSDRGRGARRRPWAVGGSWLTAACLVLTGLAHGLWLVGVAWVGVCLGAAVASAAFTALIADQLPTSRRGAASAVIGSSQAVGVVIGVAVVVLLGLGVVAGYLLMAAVVAAAGTVAALALPDPAGRGEGRSERRVRGLASLTRERDFLRMLLGRLFVNIGNALVTALLLFYLLHGLRLGRDAAETDLLLVIVVYAVFVVAASVVFGVVSDRRAGRRVPAVVAAAVQAGSPALLLIHPSWGTTLVAGALMGIGYGAYSTVGLALATDLLPRPEDHARDLGVVQVVAALGQLIGPVLGAGLVVLSGGFVGVFVGSLVLTLLGAVVTATVTEPSVPVARVGPRP